MKWFKCKECRVQFEHDPEISEKPDECPDCSSHAIVPVKVNEGFIEHGRDEKYELSLDDNSEVRQDEDDEDDEPGSIFDKRELDDEDEDDED